MTSGIATYALFKAIHDGNTNEAAKAIAADADINAKAEIWPHPAMLHLAALGGHDAIVQLLIEKGAPVNSFTDAGETALHWATFNGHISTVKLLKDHGVYADAMDNLGRTCLDMARLKDNPALLDALSPTTQKHTDREGGRRRGRGTSGPGQSK